MALHFTCKGDFRDVLLAQLRLAAMINSGRPVYVATLSHVVKHAMNYPAVYKRIRLIL